MMKQRGKRFILFITLVYLLGQVGCATGRLEYPKPEPLSEAYRAQLGTIGVVSVPGEPDIHVDRLTSPSQPGVLTRMGQGAWEGAKTSVQWYSDLLDSSMNEEVAEGLVKGPVVVLGPLGLVVGLVILAPIIPLGIFGSLGGAIGGAFGGAEPRNYAEETETGLQEYLEKFTIQEALQRTFLKEARFRTSHTFMEISEKGEQTSKGAAGQGEDSILELNIQRIELERIEDREGDMNPSMVLVLVGRVRLIQATEKTVWYEHFFVHKTEKRPYTYYWQNIYNPYYGLQEDLKNAFKKLSEQMVEKLFYQKQTDQISSPATSNPSGFSTETTLISQP